jgi:hypothetical protein
VSRTRTVSRTDGGFALLTTALSLVVLVGLLGLAIDVGRVYVAKSEIQNFADSASLAATLQLDGTWTGISRALSEVSINRNTWNFSTSTVAGPQTAFASSPAGPWVTTPTDPAGLRYARVLATADVPVTFIYVFLGAKPATVGGAAAFLMSQATLKVTADSAGGQLPKTSWSEGLFPFSPFAHDTTGPYFGLIPGQQYTLRWAANPRLNANTCPGDDVQSIIDLAGAGGGSERGFIESTSASLIRQTIVADYQTVTRSVGDVVNMTGGAKQTQLSSLIERVNQDTDSASPTFATYMSLGRGNGRRIVGAPINTGSPGYKIVQIGAFFLLPPSMYSAGGNAAFCAEFLGAWVQGARNRGAGDPGAYVARLIQ